MAKKRKKKNKERNYDFFNIEQAAKLGKVGGNSKQRLDLIKAQMIPLQDLAYQRIEELRANDAADFSKAYLDAVDKIPKRNSGKIFDLEAAKSFKELSTELTRIQKFISEADSKTEIADINREFAMHRENWKGEFGNDWKATHGESYNTARIDEEQAKAMFSIYRQLERDFGYLAIKGPGGFGSDNLIYMVADYVIENDARGQFTDTDPQFSFIKKIEEKLTQFQDLRDKQAEEEYVTGDVDTDLLNKAGTIAINRRAVDVLNSWLF